jgi:phage baseplate assembly protein W
MQKQAKMNEGRLYGQGIGFPPRIGSDGRVAWSAGPANIRDSIRVILLTEPGERVMLRSFGGGLQRFLFEPNIVTTHRLIRQHITQALERWEPRIRLQSVIVEPDPEDPQAAVVTINYKLVTTGTGDRISLTMQLTG